MDFALFDIASERQIVGSMVASPAALSQAIDSVNLGDLANGSMQVIFDCIKDMYGEGIPVDQTTLAARLVEHGKLNHAGGVGGLRSLVAGAENPANLNHYIAIVKDRHLRRDVRSASENMMRAAHKSAHHGELVDYVEQQAFDIRQRHLQKDGGRGAYTSEELADDFASFLTSEEAEDPRIPFPTPALQSDTGGYSAGELVIIAGYSGDGKSVYALDMLEAACKHGARVGYWSLEMPERQVQRRLVAMSGIPMEFLRKRKLSEEQMQLASDRLDELRGYDYTIVSGTSSMDSIRAEQMRRRYDVVIVDHLHRMHGCEDRETLERYTRACKNLALDGDCAVVALAQLSRREGFPPPSTNQLRGTDVLTQEADSVLFVYRQRDMDGMRQQASQLIVAKMRDARSDYWVDMHFDPDFMKFSTLGEVRG